MAKVVLENVSKNFGSCDSGQAQSGGSRGYSDGRPDASGD
jgi:hypothetical protein